MAKNVKTEKLKSDPKKTKKSTKVHVVKGMTNGGARPGAGRKKGGVNKSTLEKRKVELAMHQRILTHVDKIINAQLNLAQGLSYVYRIDEEELPSGKIIRKNTLVTDPDEIKAVLDDTDGAGGLSDENYYFITTKAPDIRALDSMLDRVFGKARNTVGVDGGEGVPLRVILDNIQSGKGAKSPAEEYLDDEELDDEDEE